MSASSVPLLASEHPPRALAALPPIGLHTVSLAFLSLYHRCPSPSFIPFAYSPFPNRCPRLSHPGSSCKLLLKWLSGPVGHSVLLFTPPSVSKPQLAPKHPPPCVLPWPSGKPLPWASVVSHLGPSSIPPFSSFELEAGRMHHSVREVATWLE